MNLDFTSCVLKDKLYFGGYPCPSMIDNLNNHKFTIIIDTTSKQEKYLNKLFIYNNLINKLGIKYFNFPINDSNIPNDIESFKQFIRHLVNIFLYYPNEKFYIHCRGGHGRSGLLISGLLCYIYNMIPEKAIEMTTNAHKNRVNLKLKWKNIKCPQNFIQRKFIYDYFKPIKINHDYINIFSNSLYQSFPRPIIINNNDPFFKMKEIYCLLRQLVVHGVFLYDGNIKFKYIYLKNRFNKESS